MYMDYSKLLLNSIANEGFEKFATNDISKSFKNFLKNSPKMPLVAGATVAGAGLGALGGLGGYLTQDALLNDWGGHRINAKDLKDYGRLISHMAPDSAGDILPNPARMLDNPNLRKIMMGTGSLAGASLAGLGMSDTPIKKVLAKAFKDKKTAAKALLLGIPLAGAGAGLGAAGGLGLAAGLEISNRDPRELEAFIRGNIDGTMGNKIPMVGNKYKLEDLLDFRKTKHSRKLLKSLGIAPGTSFLRTPGLDKALIFGGAGGGGLGGLLLGASTAAGQVVNPSKSITSNASKALAKTKKAPLNLLEIIKRAL
jgi:hypothetical protein